MTLTRLPLALAGLLLIADTTARAHHSYAAVDMTRQLTIQGTVTTLEWTNPHVWVWITALDERGGTVPYAFEATSPSELTRFFGWNKRVLSAGQPIAVAYAPFRNGDHGGALLIITFADGGVLRGRQVASDGAPAGKGPAREEPREGR